MTFREKYQIYTRPSVRADGPRVWLVRDPSGEPVTGGMVFSLTSALEAVQRDLDRRRAQHLCHDLPDYIPNVPVSA